jgi:hypothetical protein
MRLFRSALSTNRQYETSYNVVVVSSICGTTSTLFAAAADVQAKRRPLLWIIGKTNRAGSELYSVTTRSRSSQDKEPPMYRPGIRRCTTLSCIASATCAADGQSLKRPQLCRCRLPKPRAASHVQAETCPSVHRFGFDMIRKSNKLLSVEQRPRHHLSTTEADVQVRMEAAAAFAQFLPHLLKSRSLEAIARFSSFRKSKLGPRRSRCSYNSFHISIRRAEV